MGWGEGSNMFKLIKPLICPHGKDLEMLANGIKAAESLRLFKSKKTPPSCYTKNLPNCPDIQQALRHAEGTVEENYSRSELQKGDFIHPSFQRVINWFWYFIKTHSFKRGKVSKSANRPSDDYLIP